MLDTAFILAAGLGTRMRPLTEFTAKPLLYYRGERLIERHLRRLAHAGFKRVVINCSWQGQQLRQIIGDGSNYGLEILYSCEDGTPLETASGLSRASALMGKKPFLLLNGDIWTDLTLNKPGEHTHSPCIVLVDNPGHNPKGDFALSSNSLVLNQGNQLLTYAGIGIYTMDFLNGSAVSGAKLADKLRESAARNALRGIRHTGEWFDIGTPSALNNQ